MTRDFWREMGRALFRTHDTWRSTFRLYGFCVMFSFIASIPAYLLVSLGVKEWVAVTPVMIGGVMFSSWMTRNDEISATSEGDND